MYTIYGIAVIIFLPVLYFFMKWLYGVLGQIEDSRVVFLIIIGMIILVIILTKINNSLEV